MYLVTRYTTNVHFMQTFGTRFFWENNATPPPRSETPPHPRLDSSTCPPDLDFMSENGWASGRVDGWADSPTLVITHANVD